MCIFSKTLLFLEPVSKPKGLFDCRKTVNKVDHSLHKQSALKRANQCRLDLLLSYGIVPLTFDLLRALGYSAATVGIGTTTAVGVPGAATAAGFTANGIAAGSIAAWIQSSIGSVAAGSTFATLQSIGATGGFAILGPISLIAGAVGLTIASGTFIGIGIDKHIKEINNFAKNTKLILPHV